MSFDCYVCLTQLVVYTNNKFSFLFKSYLIYLTVELTGVRKVNTIFPTKIFFGFSFFEWMNASMTKSQWEDLKIFFKNLILLTFLFNSFSENKKKKKYLIQCIIKFIE